MGKTDVITYKYVINGVNTVQGIEHLDFSQGILCLLVHDCVPVATYVTWNPEVKKKPSSFPQSHGCPYVNTVP
jgi:hypothetical protein